MNTERFRILFHSYLERSITVAEENELMQMLANPALESDVKELIEDSWTSWQERELLLKEQSDDLYASIQQAISELDIRSPKIVPMTSWRSITAAAAVILLLGAGTYLWLNRTPKTEQTSTATGHPIKNDVAPGGNKAILTLANGSAIVLDSAHTGTLAQQGNAAVIKQNDGQLAYNALHEKPTEVLYNTLATPRGGQYQLVLPDGSKVWLNAASSIRYPTAFTGTERKVEIIGEAYFEVANNEKMPFVVKMVSASGDKGEVKVLGTQFNVNAYDDEETVRTTLLEGSVLVKKDAATAILKPGQQSRLTKSGKMEVVGNADIEEALAWKNGQLLFRHADMATIMRQAARWYDVDIEYKDRIEDTYTFNVPRNVPVSQLFHALEMTSSVHFEIDGKKITVSR